MPWLSRNNFSPTDKLHSDDLNNLANDDRTWGGNVNGGGYTLSNVNIVGINPTAGGAVSSVFGRTGDVVAQNGDYTPAQVGAVPIARQVIAGPGLTGGGALNADVTLTAAVQSFNTRIGAIVLTQADITNASGVISTRKVNTAAGSGLTGGGALSADLSLSVVADSSNQQIQVMSQGSPIGSPRHAINFVSGTGALVTVQEITAQNRIDVTVSSTGTGGFVDPTQVTGDLIVRGLTAPPTRLPVGTDGQVLTADHLQALGMKWATPSGGGTVTSVFGRSGVVTATAGDYTVAMVTNAVDQTGSYVNPPWITSLPWSKITNPPAFMLDPTSTKGDLIVHGTTTTRLPAGADTTVLTADSSLALGVRWGALPVTSVFGRAGGDVVAMSGDYTVGQVTGAVPNTLTINTPVGSGLSGGGNLSANRTFAVVPDTTNQQVQILLAGAAVGQPRHAVNFISGAGVVLSITENAVNNWIDIAVASSGTGSGGGLVDPTSAIGDLIVRAAALPAPPTALPLGTQGQVLTVDTAQAAKMRWATPASGGAGSQSPWVGNIDAAGNNLNNVGGIGVNAASNKAIARVYALAAASEDGFRTVSNNSAGMAAASFINDLGDSICVRSYGSGFTGPLPGLATVEATNSLAFLANAAEVMRLVGGRVLIGTTTDDGLNKLQVNGKVKSLAGGFVFPDNSVQTTAYTAGGSPVTSVFARTGAVVALAGDYTAAKVTNAVDSSSTYNNPTWITALAWSKITGAPALLVDPTTTLGDLMVRGAAAPATRLGVGTNGQVLTADSAQTLGVKWAASPAQSPWLSNIDGGGFTLSHVASINVGNTVTPVAPIHVLGSVSAGPFIGMIVANSSATVASSAQLNFALGNTGSTATGAISNLLESSSGGALAFSTYNSGIAERMRITAAGQVAIGTTTPVTSPGVYMLTVSTGGNRNIVATSGGSEAGISWQNTATSGRTYSIFSTGGSSSLGVGNFVIYDDTAATARITITAAGNVGIGTGATTPKALLDVNLPTLTAQAKAVRWGSNATGVDLGYLTTDPTSYYSGALSLCFNGTPNTFISGQGNSYLMGGNVGIGTSTPSDMLTVRPPGGLAGITIRCQTQSASDMSTLSVLHNSTGYGWRARARDNDGGFALDVQNNSTWISNAVSVASANGYMAIGSSITNPTAPLMVGGASNAPSLSTDTSVLLIHTAGAVQLSIGGNAGGIYPLWMQTKYAGNNGSSWPLLINPLGGAVGVGVSTPQGPFHVGGKGTVLGGASGGTTALASTDANLLFYLASTANWAGIGSDANGTMWFRTGTSGSPNAAVVIGTAGFVGIGNVSPTYWLHLGNDSAAKPGTSTWAVPSDLRLKRNIRPFAEGLETIVRLRPIAYTYNGEDNTPDGMEGVGLVAQEAEEVIPSCIHRTPGRIAGESTEVLGLNPGNLTWMIVNALRQIDERLKALEGKL